MPLQLYKISSTELTTAAASITFSSIPQGYTDLKIVVSTRTDNNNGGRDYFWLRFNGDTAGNYTNTWLAGYDSGSTLSIKYTGSAFGGTFTQPDVVATANTFGNAEAYIPNYTNSSTQKSYSGDAVSENNSASSWMNNLVAGLWTKSPTAALTSITVGTQTGNFVANSTFTLYGIL
jgi:hypothetical protein